MLNLYELTLVDGLCNDIHTAITTRRSQSHRFKSTFFPYCCDHGFEKEWLETICIFNIQLLFKSILSHTHHIFELVWQNIARAIKHVSGKTSLSLQQSIE